MCDECYKCQLCKKNSHSLITNEQSEKWEAGMWLCRDCCDNKEGNKKSPTDKGKEPSKDRKPNSNETCERCGTSCVVSETKTSYT